MSKQFSTLDSLISEATIYIKHQLNYSGSTVCKYTRSWRQLKEYMELNKIKSYSIDVEIRIFNHLFKDRIKRELSDSEQDFYSGIQKLTEFQQTGKIKARHHPKHPRVLDGPIGKIMNLFLEYKRVEDRLTAHSHNSHKRNLFQLLSYCKLKRIESLEEINLNFILEFISSLDGRKSTVIPSQISTLRIFIRYAFEKKYLSFDFSKKIPKYKSIRQPKLPSVYTKEDIKKLIDSVDRSSSIGKRNYAIILIAARLGLRAIDIARLQFDHLHWSTSSIKLIQLKTGKELELPLLPDIGNAIIDYLKYGRPNSDEPYIFLKARPPYGTFPTSAAVSHLVQRAFKNAGIGIREKKFGPHALRHSLGFRMLEESTVLPVISQVLGHQSSESTKFYLRIDLQSMRHCVLDVPIVPKAFYEQKKGFFYEQ